VPLIAKGRVQGVLELFHRSPVERNPEWSELLNTMVGQAAVAIDNANLFTDLQQANIEMVMAYDSTLEGWAKALELRDMETEGHSRRVVDLTLHLAQMFEIGEKQMVHIRRGALLHDIGKMGIPDAILQKPGPLDEAEWQIMRQHPVYAYEWLSPINYLRPALDIPYCHHEHWDGGGYPRGLQGEQIALAARLFAVVDVWDALRSDRPYRQAWPEARVREYLQDQAGMQFDPQVVARFLRMNT
jgi:HD-GYP domain-containing protein (c-di-GMP phosphodiesterase class II)